MRLTVFGATGGTGALLVEQALTVGHRVTAVVRRGWPGPHHPRLRVAVADVLNPSRAAEPCQWRRTRGVRRRRARRRRPRCGCPPH
jgi:putative NADH-flavin reductase